VSAWRNGGADLPSYSELPKGVSGAGSAWNVFDKTGDLGLVNLQTKARVRKALRLGKDGKVFCLSAPLDLFDPVFFAGRGKLRHQLMQKSAYAFDDVLDNFFPQASSQWDGLGHVGAADGMFYGGMTSEDIQGGRNSIDGWARKGIVGRAVVLNTAALRDEDDRTGEDAWVANSNAISVADLEEARKRAGVNFECGDIILLYTGFLDWYSSQSMETRQRFVQKGVCNGGLEHSEEMADFLWNTHALGVAADNIAVEQWPPNYSKEASPFGFLHQVLIGEFGMALGELWDLGALARDCLEDGVYECCVVSSPMRLERGVGSPANALAIK